MGNYGDNKKFFSAVCDKCGKDCKVPFKPSGNKPVLCSECFEEERGVSTREIRRSRGGSNNDQVMKKLDYMEDKLNRILELLEEDKNSKTYRVGKTTEIGGVDIL